LSRKFELSGKPRRGISPTFLILLLLWARLAPHAVLVPFFSVRPFSFYFSLTFRPAGHVVSRKKVAS
jgi:hypothetical protein